MSSMLSTSARVQPTPDPYDVAVASALAGLREYEGPLQDDLQLVARGLELANQALDAFRNDNPERGASALSLAEIANRRALEGLDAVDGPILKEESSASAFRELVAVRVSDAIKDLVLGDYDKAQVSIHAASKATLAINEQIRV